MTRAEIIAAVDAGQTVHWANAGYVVVKDSLGQYLIVHRPTGAAIGLTNRAGDRLNGQPEAFFVATKKDSASSAIHPANMPPAGQAAAPR